MNKDKCDVCGQFVSYMRMHRKMITPDSDYSKEEWETLCNKCHEKEYILKDKRDLVLDEKLK